MATWNPKAGEQPCEIRPHEPLKPYTVYNHIWFDNLIWFYYMVHWHTVAVNLPKTVGLGRHNGGYLNRHVSCFIELGKNNLYKIATIFRCWNHL